MKKTLTLVSILASSFLFVEITSADTVTGVQAISPFNPAIFTIIILTALWTIPWKAVALWKAARNNSKPWFIILLLVNTLAILEILYIFIFSKKGKAQQN